MSEMMQNSVIQHSLITHRLDGTNFRAWKFQIEKISKKIKWNMPDSLPDQKFNELWIKLNSKQREFAMHVIHCFTTGKD